MAIALVGSLGAGATGTTTASPTFGQSTTAGNCCVCWFVTASGQPTLSGVSGWAAQTFGGSFFSIAFKPNCGAGETAPTINGVTFTAGALAEFSGVDRGSGVVDQTFNNLGTTSPNTLVLSNVDQLPGELWATVSMYVYSMAATKTTSHGYSSGTSQGAATWNNDSTSTANHFRFSYAITTSNGVVMTITDTFTSTNISTRAGAAQSAKVLQFPPPSLVTPRSPN